MKNAAVWMAIVIAGCAPDLVADGGDAGTGDATSGGSIPAVSGAFRHAVDEHGVVTTIVDATDDAAWQRLDLESGDATDDASRWDLGFSRFYVVTNGGASGSGGAAAARSSGGWDAIDRAPEDGWIADAPDSADDTDTGPDTAWNGGPDGANDWYAYDASSHRLTPRPELVVVVRTVEGGFFKVQLLGYYDGAGTPAVILFRWARVEGGEVVLPDAGPTPDAGPPPLDGGRIVVPSGAIVVDASDRAAFTYVSVEHGVVSIADAASSTGWDLAFRRTAIRTSSGTSGPGVGGARAAGEVALESVSSTDTIGFAIDELVDGESASPVLTEWFDYDVGTHTVTPKPIVWIVRAAGGGYARMRIWSWEGGVYRISLDPIVAAPAMRVLEVDASSSGEWAYVDLRAAASVTVDDASSDRGWDLGLSRTLLRTSSGTSGPGAGGAIDTGVAEPASVTEIPADGWVIDEVRPLPGPPGAGTYSGNAALEGWYDYDPVTHAVTPRPTTFLVRLADGSGGRLRILGWSAGRFTLEWTYAGPARSALEP